MILSWKVRVAVPETPRYKSPLVCTRPSKSSSGLEKKPKSLSENTPNWNTGIKRDFDGAQHAHLVSQGTLRDDRKIDREESVHTIPDSSRR